MIKLATIILFFPLLTSLLYAGDLFLYKNRLCQFIDDVFKRNQRMAEIKCLNEWGKYKRKVVPWSAREINLEDKIVKYMDSPFIIKKTVGERRFLIEALDGSQAKLMVDLDDLFFPDIEIRKHKFKKNEVWINGQRLNMRIEPFGNPVSKINEASQLMNTINMKCNNKSKQANTSKNPYVKEPAVSEKVLENCDFAPYVLGNEISADGSKGAKIQKVCELIEGRKNCSENKFIAKVFGEGEMNDFEKEKMAYIGLVELKQQGLLSVDDTPAPVAIYECQEGIDKKGVIVMERWDGNWGKNEGFGETMKFEQVKEVVNLLKRLHKNGRFHGDAHAGNFVYRGNKEDTVKIAMIDFADAPRTDEEFIGGVLYDWSRVYSYALLHGEKGYNLIKEAIIDEVVNVKGSKIRIEDFENCWNNHIIGDNPKNPKVSGSDLIYLKMMQQCKLEVPTDF